MTKVIAAAVAILGALFVGWANLNAFQIRGFTLGTTTRAKHSRRTIRA